MFEMGTHYWNRPLWAIPALLVVIGQHGVDWLPYPIYRDCLICLMALREN